MPLSGLSFATTAGAITAQTRHIGLITDAEDQRTANREK